MWGSCGRSSAFRLGTLAPVGDCLVETCALGLLVNSYRWREGELIERDWSSVAASELGSPSVRRHWGLVGAGVEARRAIDQARTGAARTGRHP